MPIIFQSRIYRADLQANPKVTYIFGDNYDRIGLGGQAKEMRGEPNAHGIATKISPSMDERAFFYEGMASYAIAVLAFDFDKLRSKLLRNHTIVWPLDGIGTGLSELPTRAPTIHQYILDQLERLKGM